MNKLNQLIGTLVVASTVNAAPAVNAASDHYRQQVATLTAEDRNDTQNHLEEVVESLIMPALLPPELESMQSTHRITIEHAVVQRPALREPAHEAACVDEGFPHQAMLHIPGGGILHINSRGLPRGEHYAEVFDVMINVLQEQLPQLASKHSNIREYTIDAFTFDESFIHALERYVARRQLDTLVAHEECGAAKLSLQQNVEAILRDHLLTQNFSVSEQRLQQILREVMKQIPDELVDLHARKGVEDLAARLGGLKTSFMPMPHGHDENRETMHREHHLHRAGGSLVTEIPNFTFEDNALPLHESHLIDGLPFRISVMDFENQQEIMHEIVQDLALTLQIQLGKAPLPEGKKFSLLFVRSRENPLMDTATLRAMIDRLMTYPIAQERRQDIIFRVIDVEYTQSVPLVDLRLQYLEGIRAIVQ